MIYILLIIIQLFVKLYANTKGAQLLNINTFLIITQWFVKLLYENIMGAQLLIIYIYEFNHYSVVAKLLYKNIK